MTCKKSHKIRQAVTSIFLMLSLLWLTVSIPFVYAGQQKIAAEKKIAAHQQQQTNDDSADNGCSPFGNNTEEKAPSSGINTLSEEYLHHGEDLFHAFELFMSHHHVQSVDEYVSFHGEMLCPPPNVLS